jgi:hypothetical protein
MERSFGTRRKRKPEGMLREVHWPSMGRMDQRTTDGRMLLSDGGGTRHLPQTFFFQFAQSAFGHEGAVPVGRVDQVIFHEDGNIEGWGWLVDTEAGRDAALHIRTKMQRTNSLDLGDVKAKVDLDDDWNLLIDFVAWNIAGTTGVGKPAFADARMELTPETTAAFFDETGPLEVEHDEWRIGFELKVPELTASAADTVPWGDFNIPESDVPHKILVDAEGRVFGHLAQWDDPHRSSVDRLRFCPRPTKGYSEFNHPGPLTENGQVGTGPIFLCGGHPQQSMRGKTAAQINQAYGGTENTWADVRVSEGFHGPWVSGRVRPGLDDDKLYAARASHISGHWLGDDLVAIVSVNVPGFRPGAGFAAVEDGRVVELVASFTSEQAFEILEPVIEETTTTHELTITQHMTFNFGPDGITVADASPVVDTSAHTTSAEHRRRALALQFGLDDD